MSKQPSESDVIKLSLNLLSEEDRLEIRQDAQKLLLAVHDRNRRKPRYAKAMFGEAMSFETLYKLGRWLNEEYPEDGTR